MTQQEYITAHKTRRDSIYEKEMENQTLITLQIKISINFRIFT